MINLQASRDWTYEMLVRETSRAQHPKAMLAASAEYAVSVRRLSFAEAVDITTFLELQNELISVTSARFKEAQRESIKKWINHRYSILWGLDNWSFKLDNPLVSVTANNSTVTTPTNLGVVFGLWASDGTRIDYLSPEDFNDVYYGNTTTGTIPSDFTIVNGVMSVGPTPSVSSSTYKLLHEKRPHYGSNPLTGPPLVADGDVPMVPVEYHYMLVPGSTAVGSIQMNDFTYQFAEQEWQNDLESLRRAYLRDQRGAPLTWGASAPWEVF